MEGQCNDTCFFFERAFEPVAARSWMKSHWHFSVFCSAIYVILIYSGSHVMKSRSAYALRLPMAGWSALLAAYSIMGSYRLVPAIVRYVKQLGGLKFICDPIFYLEAPSAFWCYTFAVSKLFELGDTVFIVLRKQKLSFLHWYHHVTVFVYCWHGYGSSSTTGLAFGGMNFVVHSLMYTYYTLRALRIRLPRLIAASITLLQLSQMFVGVAINIVVLVYKRRGFPCLETDFNVYAAFIMYLSYVLLFVNFFYQTYLKTAKIKHANGEAKKVQ